MKKSIFSLSAVATLLLFINIVSADTLGTVASWNMEDGVLPRTWGNTTTRDVIYAPDISSNVLHILSPANGNGGIQYVGLPVVAGATYDLKFDAKVVSGKIRPVLGINTSNRDFMNQNIRLPSGNIGDSHFTWFTYTRRFTVPTNFVMSPTSFRIVFVVYRGYYVGKYSPGEAYLDNVVLTKVADPAPVTTAPTTSTDTTSTSTPTQTSSSTSTSTPTPISSTLTDWASDVDHDGTDDHEDTTIAVPDFTGACQLPPSLWGRADFNDVKTNMMVPVATRLGVAWNDYDALCVKNDPDKDWLFTQAPWGPLGGDAIACRYNDPHPTVADTGADNDCSGGFTYKPYVPSTTTPPPTTPPTTNPPPPTTPPTIPPDTTMPPTTTTPPTPIPGADSYPNQQGIDFSAFHTLSAASFTGKDFYVSPTGSDANIGSATAPLLTVTAALSKVNVGDKIFLRGGTYNSLFWGLTKPVYIGAYNNEAVTININDPSNGRGIQIGNDKIMLEGLNLNISNPAGIAIYTSKDIVIKNVVLTMNGSSDFRQGILALSPNTGLWVENTTITGTDIGLSCNTGPCSNWKISNVKIVGRGMNAASSGRGADCFAFENGHNLALINLESTQCPDDGIDVKGTNVFIYSPLVHNTGRNGIKMWNGGDLVNALVYDTAADVSVFLGNTGLTRVINSTIALHSRSGGAYMLVAAYDAPYNTGEKHVKIINSIFYSNTGDLIGMPNVNGTTRTFEMQNSVLYQVGLPSVFRALITQPGTNNLVDINPMFVNPTATGDFHLQSGSPAINKGVNTEYPLDVSGKTRPSGAFDMGAYER